MQGVHHAGKVRTVSTIAVVLLAVSVLLYVASAVATMRAVHVWQQTNRHLPKSCYHWHADHKGGRGCVPSPFFGPKGLTSGEPPLKYAICPPATLLVLAAFWAWRLYARLRDDRGALWRFLHPEPRRPVDAPPDGRAGVLEAVIALEGALGIGDGVEWCAHCHVTMTGMADAEGRPVCRGCIADPITGVYTTYTHGSADCPQRIDVSTHSTGPNTVFVHGNCQRG